MSLKQFPSHGTFSKEADERAAAEKRQQLAARGQQHEDDPYHGHGPRLTAAVFNVEQAWDMLDEKKQHLQVESEDTSGMDQMNRNEAARVAAAAGVKIDNTMTVGQAVQIYSRQKFHEIRFYLFYIAYITSVFILRADNLQSNSVFRTLRNSVAERPFAFRNSTMIFREVSSHEHFWEYLEHGVPEQLFSNVGGYDPGTFELVSHDGSTGMLYVSKYNMMVQPVRIRQLRVAQEQIRESDSCEVNLKMSETVTTCWPVYAPEQESALPWVGQDGSELGFQGADALQTSMHTRGTAFNYGGGGTSLIFHWPLRAHKCRLCWPTFAVCGGRIRQRAQYSSTARSTTPLETCSAPCASFSSFSRTATCARRSRSAYSRARW